MSHEPHVHPLKLDYHPGLPIPLGKTCMWLFLSTEIMFFAGLIGTYIVLRFGAPAWPRPHDVHLVEPIGALNTFILICSSVSIVLAHGRSLVPPHLLGRTMTLRNIGTMGGGFVVQLISGALIELFPSEGGAYPLEAYRLVFGLQAAFMLVALVAYFGSREGHLAAK